MRLTRRTVLIGIALTGCTATMNSRNRSIFKAADGAPVSGVFYGRGSRAALLVPGGHGIGETWEMQAQKLAKAGFRVLAMDYRGRGHSPQVPPDDEKAHLDVLGAVRQLRAEGAEQVSVVAASWGGWAAGTAAVLEPESIDRLVLLAHSPFEGPERLKCRTFFIVAEEDRDGTARLRLEAIREQFEKAPDPKDLLVLPGAAHAQYLFLTSQRARLERELVRFLSKP